VDILGSPQRCLLDGIRMVPALVIDGDKLSGIFLNKKKGRKVAINLVVCDIM